MAMLAGIEPRLAGLDDRSSADRPISRTYACSRCSTKRIEWAEDQIIFRYGGDPRRKERSHLKEQALLAGLSDDELASLAALGTARSYRAGQRIVAADEPAASLFFLKAAWSA